MHFERASCNERTLSDDGTDREKCAGVLQYILCMYLLNCNFIAKIVKLLQCNSIHSTIIKVVFIVLEIIFIGEVVNNDNTPT